MPYQKNWVPSVAMNEGMPILATSRPLMKPTSTPEAMATSRAIARLDDSASQREPVRSSASLNSTAKTKPEKPMIAGKQRSISPAPMMKVRPTASRISGGSVDRKVV